MRRPSQFHTKQNCFLYGNIVFLIDPNFVIKSNKPLHLIETNNLEVYPSSQTNVEVYFNKRKKNQFIQTFRDNKKICLKESLFRKTI